MARKYGFAIQYSSRAKCELIHLYLGNMKLYAHPGDDFKSLLRIDDMLSCDICKVAGLDKYRIQEEVKFPKPSRYPTTTKRFLISLTSCI